MKKIYFAIFLHFVSIQILNTQWAQMINGLGNLYVYSYATIGNNIFAGTETGTKGVFISTNNGANWTQAGMNGLAIYALAANGNNLFAGTSSGAWYSTNSGLNWIQTSLNNETILSFGIGSGKMFAGTSAGGVYVSTNGGINWIQSALNNRSISSIAIIGNNIFAGSVSNPGYGAYLSTDNGIVWDQTSLNNRDVRSMAVIGNNVFAGTIDFGVYVSTNNGTSWTQTALNNERIFALAVIGPNIFAGSGFIAACNGCFYVSSNNGTSWTQRNEGMSTGYQIDAFCILNNFLFTSQQSRGAWRRGLNELVVPWLQPPLNSPVNNSINQQLNPLLVFSRVPVATSFQVRVSPDSLFAATVFDSLISDSSVTIPPGRLSNNVKYFWSVRGTNVSGYGQYSAANSFTTTPPVPVMPALIYPSDNSSGIIPTTKLDWSTIPFAASYRVQVSTDAAFATTQFDSVTAVDSIFVPPGRLNNNTTYYWHVRSQNIAGNSNYTANFMFTTSLVGISNNNEIPGMYKLYNNLPNPFNPSTHIRFALPKSSLAKLVIYDILGREIVTLVNEQLKAGIFEVDFDATTLSTGVYYFKLTAGDFTDTKKMVLIK